MSAGSSSYPSNSVGPGDPDPVVGVELQRRRRRAARRRRRTPPQVSADAVGRDDPHAGGLGPAAQRRVDRAAAEQHGVSPPQRRDVGRVVEHPVQLGGHQRGAPAVAVAARLLERLVAGDQRAACTFSPATYDAGSVSTQGPAKPEPSLGRPRRRRAPPAATARPASAARSSPTSRRPTARRRRRASRATTGANHATEASAAWSDGSVPLRQRIARVLPPTPLARRLSVQSVLFAIGEGTFLTGSAVFFTQIVGLTAGQVGLGLTVGRRCLVRARRADRQARRPDRAEADVGDRRVPQRRPVRRLAVHRRLRAVPRDDGRARGGRHGRLRRPRRLHDRRVPARGAGAVAGLHARRAQHRLHARRADRRHRAGLRQRRHRPRRPVAHRGDPAGQRRLRHPAASRPRSREPAIAGGDRAVGAARARCATAASSRSTCATACSAPTRCCSTW